MILSKNGDIWAYYYVRPKNINLQDTDKVDEFKREFRYTMQELSKRYASFDLSVYPFEVNLTEQFSELAMDFNESHEDIAKKYATRTVEILKKRHGNITRPRFVLGVKLKKFSEVSSRLRAFTESGKNVADTLMNILIGKKDVDLEAFGETFEAEKELYGELSAFQAERLKTEDTAYLLKLNFLRNAIYNVADETREQTINELDEVIITPYQGKGISKLTTEYGEQYVSVLPLSSLPDYTLNTSLFYKVQSLPYPVEFHIKANALDNDGITGVKARISNKRQLFKVNVNESVQLGDPASLQLAKNIKKTEMIQGDFEQDLTIFEWLGVFVVYGSTVEVVKNRVRHLKKIFWETRNQDRKSTSRPRKTVVQTYSRRK